MLPIRHSLLLFWLPLALGLSMGAGCRSVDGDAGDEDFTGVEICSLETQGTLVEQTRPAPDEEPVDDVNWFARPVANESGDWIIAFASHDQNYLYNLTTGVRVKIPDRSDAVATPDGRYMTVPSNYTPDQYIRFYDVATLLTHLEEKRDADGVPPVFIHEHPDLRKVYYQSTALLSHTEADGRETNVYRLMFSGTRDEAGFRIVDYTFSSDLATGALTVAPSEPMALCPEIPNDLNTPFISKDGNYVVSYTSSSEKREFTPGSSLKIFRILGTDPARQTTACREVVDFGFAAGKADFSFDGSMLTFHVSKGSYLTPFINGGLESPTVTDVVFVELTRDAQGEIQGYGELARVTTSLRDGVGSYFPAFLPDGKLFYVVNAEPKNSDAEKRFHFKVVDPARERLAANVFADPDRLKLARAIGRLWESHCGVSGTAASAEHELPWIFTSLSPAQCQRLVVESSTRAQRERSESEEVQPGKDALLDACRGWR